MLDVHVHLFGTGDAGTGCWMTKEITESPQFNLLTRLLKLKGRLDDAYARALVEHVNGSRFTKTAILGQDARYKANGKVDRDHTHFYTPNNYVFEFVARHKNTMIACPSINPDRGDAIYELDRCYTLGARLFKIHPPTQGVDVADPKHEKFFRRCRELGMVVLVHTGHEHSAPVVNADFANPRRLERALDQGCTIVACHAGSGWVTDKTDQLPFFLALLKRYKNLWGDTSVLGTGGRVRDFRRLLEVPLARERLLHGSDFPFVVTPGAFAVAGMIRRGTADRVDQERSWVQRDLALKEALGIGHVSARRGYRMVMG